MSDGYCNARAARFSAAGEFVSSYSISAAKAKAGGLPAGASSSELNVAHSVAVDECARRLYVADREGGRVVAFDLHSGALALSADVSRLGRVWALAPGPYGRMLALAWERGRNATLVDVSAFDAAAPLSWSLPGTEDLYPHDIALGAAPLALSGAGDRLFAVYVAPCCGGADARRGALQKFVLFPTAYGRQRAAAAAAAAAAAGGGGRPVLAHFAGGHAKATAAATAAAAKKGGEDDDAAAGGKQEPQRRGREEEDDDEEGQEEEAAGAPAKVARREAKPALLTEEERRGGPGSGSSGKSKAAAADADEGEEDEDDAGSSGEVHAVLRGRPPAPRQDGGGGGSGWLGQLATAGAVIAAAAAAALGVRRWRRRNSGGFGGGGARHGGRGGGGGGGGGVDILSAGLGGSSGAISSEMVKLPHRSYGGGGDLAQRSGANGHHYGDDGCAGELVFGRDLDGDDDDGTYGGGGLNGGGLNGGGGANSALAAADEDLERLEREVLLRGAGGPRS